MKWMTQLRLINWHYFSDVTMDFGKQTLITGQNAAGKSTIIDALQVLFVADQRMIRFNAAAHDEAKRSFVNYLKGKIGSDDRSFLRDGDFTTYMVAEFRDEDKKEWFVIGVVIDVYRDRNYEDEYFILAKTRLQDLIFVNADNKLLNREAFKRRYGYRAGEANGEGTGWRNKALFERNKTNYQKALLARMGQLQDRFFRVFTKALSFKPIQDIRVFVYDYILDKRELQLDLMKQNFEIHERYRAELEELQERKMKLQGIRDSYQKLLQHKETIKEQDYVVRKLRVVLETERLEEETQKKATTEARLLHLQQEIHLAEEKHKEAAVSKLDAYQRWQNNEAERRKRELEAEIRNLESKHLEFERLIAVFSQQLQQEWKAVEELLGWPKSEYWAWEEEELIKLSLFQETLAQLMNVVDHGVVERHEEEQWAEKLAEIGLTLASMHERLIKSETKLGDALDATKVRIDELKRLIMDLEQKRRSYREPITKLKSLLEERLKDKSAVWVFCEEVEVKIEGWRNALEGYLNTQRFDLLVEPEWFAEALRIYEREKWNHQLEGVGLVDTEKERRYLNSSEKDSLALELQVDHPVILAHAEHLLGKVMKAANEQELRKYRTAVTQSGMVYHNLTARQIPKKQYEVPYLGSKAIERQLEIFRAELNEALEQQGQLQRLSDQFRYFIKITDEKQSKYRTFTSNLSWMRTRRELLLALEEDRLELGNLDLKEAEQLKADYEFWSQSEQSWNQKLGELQKAVGKSEEELRHLEEKILLQAQRVKEESSRVSQWVEEYGAQSEERALLRYADAQRQTISVSQKLQNWRSSWERQQTLRENQWKQLSQLRQTYNYQHGFAGDANDEGNQSYDQLLEKIESLDIPDYQEKVLVALKESEEEFKSHFIFKLREAIEMARREFQELNHALRHFPFSNDSYHFDVTPHDRYKKFYDALMDPMLMEKGSLFDLPDNDRTAVLHELFEMLVRGEAGQLEEFTDYRQYLDFDIMVTAENGGRTRFSQVLKEKSGGETQTPFYIAILASFHHLYSEKSSRLVVFDEAFNKMDEERIQSSLRLIKDMRLQLIAAVPDEKMQYMAPEMTTTLFVSKHDYHCYVDMIDRLYDSDEAMAEVAAAVEENDDSTQGTLFDA